MESLEWQIKTFLSINYCDSWFPAYCYINSYGLGSGSGFGNGEGTGAGNGAGNGFIYGDGRGNGVCIDYNTDDAIDPGNGCGNSNNIGYGYGYGLGSGLGYGYSYGLGYGLGYGYGYGIKELNNDKVHLIDGIQTIIKSVHGNIAQGFILNSDLTLQPCYIVKERNHFAHGDTLHDAFTSLQEKLYDDSTEEERIEAFVKKFPNYDAHYSNRDLFAYHHVLTGSCRIGRESFCKDKDINLDGSTTVREFVSLTKNSYGSETIRKLPQAYKINK